MPFSFREWFPSIFWNILPTNLWTWLSRWHWSEACYSHTWPNVDKIWMGKAFFQRARFDSRSMIRSECHDSMWSRLLQPMGDCFYTHNYFINVAVLLTEQDIARCVYVNNVILPHVVQYADGLITIKNYCWWILADRLKRSTGSWHLILIFFNALQGQPNITWRSCNLSDLLTNLFQDSFWWATVPTPTFTSVLVHILQHFQMM